MDDSRKTIDFTTQATRVTADVLKGIFRDFLSGKLEKSGKKSFSTLAKSGKLESIEVTDNNIKDFLSTASKYDIDFALKKDKSTSPATYHIFFEAAKTEDFHRAFKEYAFGVSKKLEKKNVTQVVNRSQIKENAKTISQKQAQKSKEKSLNKSGQSR